MGNTSIYQEYSGFREVIPREICPFCPVFFGLKLPISFNVRELGFVRFRIPDIP